MTSEPVPMLHDDEVPITTGLVARLLRQQFPALADRPVRPLPTTGTVNAIFRLGTDLSVRLPRGARWAGSLERELGLLPRLAGATTLRIPEPVECGAPQEEYPLPWAVYRWIEGEPYDEGIADETVAAADLAAFVRELRAVEATSDVPAAGRRPLGELDEVTRRAIDAGRNRIDAAAAHDAWDQALEAPPWAGEPVWIHNDLLRPNLLVRDGRLHAVLDFGGAGVGDRAMDVVPAWSVFGSRGRSAYREALGVDDATWARARGYALHQAALIIPYYTDTHPAFAATAVRTIEQVVGDAA